MTTTESVPVDYTATLARKRMGAGALFFDGAGRVLLVEPIYKDYWEIPGGAVEADESPYQAACRLRSAARPGHCGAWPADWRTTHPFPKHAVRRLHPEAGAQCVSSARWDLHGRPSAKAVPTAISRAPHGARPEVGGGTSRASAAAAWAQRLDEEGKV